jgi:hypothetical protein
MEADAVLHRLTGVLFALSSSARRRLCLAATISGVLLISVVWCPSALAAWGAGVEATLPANANSTQGVAVSSVSCASAGNCTAVGSYYVGPGSFQGLLLTETSGSWATGVEATLPANAGSPQEVTLSSVSCASAGNCTAIGSYEDGSGNSQGLLLTETSGSWATGVEATLPANAGSHPNISLSLVSCASAGNCTAVGRYADSSGLSQGLLLTETSGSWATGVEATLPANATATAAQNVSVSSVSCASAGNCTAVGRYTDSSFNTQGLLLSETAGSWATGVQATLPTNPGSNPNVSLSSVSCASAGNCTAVGRYNISPGNYQGLLLSETAGSWATGVQATLPATATADQSVILSSVSCASAGNCAAVGRYDDNSGIQGLFLTETGGSWTTGVEATLPANADSGQEVSLNSVSCASVGNCTAIGTYFDSSFNSQGLLLTETAGSWATGVEATLPATAYSSQGVSLDSVSCAPAGNCTAVGRYFDSSENMQGLLLSSTPATPSLSVSVPSSGTAGNSISAASVSATLSAGASPTGSLTFKVFGPQSSAPTSCTSGGTTVGSPVTVSGNGISNPSAGFTPPSAGDYWWFASYTGDSNNSPASSSCGASMAETAVQTASKLADLAIAISGPARAADGSTFAETVTLTNHGPASAGEVLTALQAPNGVTVASTGGGARIGGVVYWTAGSIADGAKLSYTVTFNVSAHASGTVLIPVGAASLSNLDPNYANNAAATTVTLGPATGHAARAHRNPFALGSRLPAYLVKLAHPKHHTHRHDPGGRSNAARHHSRPSGRRAA